jgi:hypothetical protein
VHAKKDGCSRTTSRCQALEEKTWIWHAMDGRVGILLHKTNIWRTCEICQVEEHGKRTAPEGIHLQHIFGHGRLGQPTTKVHVLPSYSTHQVQQLIQKVSKLESEIKSLKQEGLFQNQRHELLKEEVT